MLSLQAHEWLSLAVIIGLTIIHYSSRYFTFQAIPQPFFMSFAAGVGISYILMFMLPMIPHGYYLLVEEYNELVAETIYLAALLGFSLFYVIDIMIIRYKEKKLKRRLSEEEEESNTQLFIAHIIFFMLYNATIGYTLSHYQMTAPYALKLFFVFGLHFITIDWGLRHKHSYDYDRYGRKLLSASILFGYLFGSFINFSDITISLVESLLLGGMMMNVIRRELPSEYYGSVSGFLLASVLSSISFIALRLF